MNLELETLQAENQVLNEKLSALQHIETANQQLIAQVIRLVKVERSMIEFQNKLDVQVNFYRQLNELAKRFKTTFIPSEILTIAMEFMLYDLNFERCLILKRDGVSDAGLDAKPNTDRSDVFRAFLWDGYDDEEVPIDISLSIADWPRLGELEHRSDSQDFVISPIDAPIDLKLGKMLGIDEFILCTIRSSDTTPQYLIAVGNTHHQATLFSRVTIQADYLLVLSNLLSQVTGAIGQALQIGRAHV